MVEPFTADLVWYKQKGAIRLGVYARGSVRRALGAHRKPVFASTQELHWLHTMPSNLIYRHPIQVVDRGRRIEAGPVFAVLAGGTGARFNGCRTDFRDLIKAARGRRELIYVVPAGHVSSESVWFGYLRRGYKDWIALPCPLPQAIYNRVPTRNLETSPVVVDAKMMIRNLELPMFNPGYFNKAAIYKAIMVADLDEYLPDSSTRLQKPVLNQMLEIHDVVYLKPNGGSIGHGIIRVERQGHRFVLQVLKNGECKTYQIPRKSSLWTAVDRHRLPGPYVLQAGKRLIHWKGRPCDFRVLLQKSRHSWHVVGKGVRVAGPESITTHVPNGGYIMDPYTVLRSNFDALAEDVNQRLEFMAVSCAGAIDEYYDTELGEMSMDVGVDEHGDVWFFEANAKPMKFDEPEIRQKSLEGILNYLGELSLWRTEIHEQ